MMLKRFFWIVMLLSVSAGFSAAQGTPDYTMRDLAQRNDFYVGAAVYTYHLDDPIHGETLSREYNMLTPENEAKACELQRNLGTFNFTKLDRLMAFAETNDMVVRGHTLLWHQCAPNWLERGPFTRDEAIGHLRDHIMTVVGRYKGRIAMWDVANEGVNDSGRGLRETQWWRWIGDDYMDLAFQFAHEADPDALLFYNDYGAEGLNAKSNAIYEMVKGMVERGVPIHGVGLQAHFEVGGINSSAIAQNIQRIGELGLQVQITEMDVRHAGQPTESILRRQAEDYHALLDICMSSEYCTAFVTWGISDKYTWLRGSNLGFFNNPDTAPLLFDDDYQPKPAYYAMLDVLAQKAGLPPVTGETFTTAETTAAVEIPPPTKSDPKQFAPDSVPGVAYYAAFPIKINLDGEIDDWANIPRAVVESGPVLPENNDTSMTFAAAADADNLYFLAEVKDSNVVYGTHDPASEWYLEDSVEFYINATGDLSASAYADAITQIGILAANLTNPDEVIIGGGNSGNAQVNAVVVETEDGYRIEASVPLNTDVWSIKPKQMGVLGFQVHLNGSSGTDRDTKLIWSAADTGDQSWSNPSLFGQLFFWSRSL
jgi:endo-1,4-beta-xylanase